MSDIFISYCNSDSDRIKSLVDIFENQGWTVWWDRKILPGKTFDQIIEEQLDKAKCVIVIWSFDSVNSNWVKAEASEAMRMKKLVPLLIDDVRIPLEFRRLQTIRLQETQASIEIQASQDLIAAIKMLVQPSVEIEELATSEVRNPRKDTQQEWNTAISKDGLGKYRTPMGMVSLLGLLAWLLLSTQLLNKDHLTWNFFIIPIISLVTLAAWPVRPVYALIGVFGLHTINMVIIYFVASVIPLQPTNILALFFSIANAILADGICRLRTDQKMSLSALGILVGVLIGWTILPPLVGDIAWAEANVFMLTFATLIVALIWPIKYEVAIVAVLLLHGLNALMYPLTGEVFPKDHGWGTTSILLALTNSALTSWVCWWREEIHSLTVQLSRKIRDFFPFDE